MKPVVRLLPCLLLFGVAAAGATEPAAEAASARSPEALEILKQVDAAIKAVHSVRCQISRELTGSALRFGAPAEGSAVLVGWADGRPEKYWAYAKSSRDGEPLELTGGGDGELHYLIDHTHKKAYEDMDPAVAGSTGGALMSMGMIEFVHPAPFDDELAADTLELLGEETVDGEPCHKIRVVYAGGQGESIWLFSKKDLLPRRRVRLFDVPDRGGAGSVATTISRLEVNIEPDPALFRLKLPEGYEKIDDFAP